MPDINITVTDKRPVCTAGTTIVCDNSDYIVHWDLDAEWSAYDTKTMRVIYMDSTYADTVFTGDSVALPPVPVPGCVQIGLYAGDIHTSRMALLRALLSVRSASGAPANPTPDVYDQLMERMAQIENPDWDQNDPTAKDYIKNRTHYVSTEQKVIVPKQTFTGKQQMVPAGQIFLGQLEGVDNTLVHYMIDNSVSLNVLYDGIEYTTKSSTEVMPFGMVVGFGNRDLGTGSGDTGTPFSVSIFPGDAESQCIIACLVDGEHTIEVTGKNFVHTIDTKYLPLKIKSPPHQIVFQKDFGVDVDDNSQIKVSAMDEPLDSPRENVFYNKRDNQLFVKGSYAKLVDTAEGAYKINSQLETQTIKGVFDKVPYGLIKLFVIDTVDYRGYSILFSVKPYGTVIDNHVIHNCIQNLAWINGHLFAFSIRDMIYAGNLKNGDMEVKRIL
nr:MAG TPA: hypothetical protein [Caudoviricetes sp.]